MKRDITGSLPYALVRLVGNKKWHSVRAWMDRCQTACGKVYNKTKTQSPFSSDPPERVVLDDISLCKKCFPLAKKE